MNARLLAFIGLLATPLLSSAQIAIDDTQTPTWLVQNVLLGNGLTVNNIVFNGVSGNTMNEQIGSFEGTNCNIGLPAGLILATGDVNNAAGPNNTGSSSLGGGNWSAFDMDLFTLAGGDMGDTIRDKACLEFDFIPTGDSLKFEFVFASDEYPEFVNSINDAFGFFLSGPDITGPFSNGAINIALIPGTAMPVTIDNVNDVVNSAYYVDNGDGFTAPNSTDPQYVQYDGFTVVMTARAAVTCGLTYHIKIIVGDASDTAWDSAVFLQAGSFASTGQVVPHLSTGINVNDTTMYEGCGAIPFEFARLGDTTNTDTVELVVGGTAIPGVDYYPPLPNQLTFQPGDTLLILPIFVPLDGDGIETFTINIVQNIVCSGQQVETDYTFYIDQPTPLAVVSDDINGLCGEQYVLAPTVTEGVGLYEYLWSTGETTPTITVGADSTTTFYFTVSDTCSVVPVYDSITVFIPQYAPLELTVSPDLAIPCLEEDDIMVEATGGNGEYIYTWTGNGVQLGTDGSITVPAGAPTYYYVTVEEGCGHVAVDSVLVTTVPLPNIVMELHDTLVFCVGDTVLLRPFSLSGGNGVYTYAWHNSGDSLLSTADTLQVGVPSDSTYTLTVMDQCGYRADSTVTTFVPHYAPFVIHLTEDTTICVGSEIELWARIAGGSGIYTIDWRGEGVSDPKLVYSGDQDKSFVVDVYDFCGEVISDEMEVIVQHPEAHILIRNEGEDDWLFQAASVPFIVPVMNWDLGDGTLSKATSIEHSYFDLDEHWVSLHIVSDEGCHAWDSLLVYPPGTIYFPSAFTPDGDGFNDMFGPVGASIEEFEMSVFDRWGHLVFETASVTNGWDGKVMGNTPATTGVYVYHYRAKGHYFPATESYGYVTLVRGSNE